jgi:DNA-binding MarR family transcriptional regulator
MTKADKNKRESKKRKIRASQVITGIAANKTMQEIADEMGVLRQTVSEILNSKEAAEIIERAQSDGHSHGNQDHGAR